MEPIVLTDEEISLINSFLDEVVDYPIVESVYLSTFRPFSLSDTKDINILVVWNMDSNYFNSLKDEFGLLDKSKEQERLFKLIEKYKAMVNDARVSFLTMQFQMLFSGFSNIAQIMSELTLANGTILYDRCGELKTKKEILSKNEGLVFFAPVIENIDSIITNGSKREGK